MKKKRRAEAECLTFCPVPSIRLDRVAIAGPDDGTGLDGPERRVSLKP